MNGYTANAGSTGSIEYTSLPAFVVVDRRCKVQCNGSTEVTKTELKVPSDASEESITLAWAALLKGLTGSEYTAFVVDLEAIEVDFSSGELRRVKIEVGDDTATAYTSVLFKHDLQQATRNAHACLQVDLARSRAVLAIDTTIIAARHVEHIVDQLSHLISCNLAWPISAQDVYSLIQGIGSTCREDGSNALSILNPMPKKLPGPSLLHDLIAPASNSTAIECLLSDGSVEQVSYKLLHSASDSLAKQISDALEFSNGRRTVPVLLHQSPRLYTAQLAILKAGAAFVPLNLDAPEERIRFVIDDVQAGAIITESSLADRCRWGVEPEVLYLDQLSLLESAASPCFQVSPKSPAYIMYTSGSTGTPKGVTLSHEATTQSLLAHDEHIPEFERFLQFASPTFDVSVFEIFFPLYRGRTLVACDRGRMLADLSGVINEMRVDAAELTPTVAGSLLGSRERVPGLRTLLTIGEMLTRSVVDDFGGGCLQAMYGPTEAAIHCTLATNIPKGSMVGNIGVPLSTVSAFVVAPARKGIPKVEVLPTGWVGELAVGGLQLADGYLNRPEQTAEVFFDTEDWGRLYRTGDRARISLSGIIECLGRVTSGQVKLRGQRIELGEVEEVVAQVIGVRWAVASVVEGSLVVYVESKSLSTVEDLKNACLKWLPRFMVPSDFVLFEQLPKLPSGKVDRKGLDATYAHREHNNYGDDFDEMNEEERVIALAVKEIIDLMPDRKSSLVMMGLDSLLSIKLSALLRQSNLHVEVLEILRADSIAGIATVSRPTALGNVVLDSVSASRFRDTSHTVREGLTASVQEEIQDIIPCSSLQEGMLTETARSPEAYCNWILLSLPDGITSAEVESALVQLINHSEILRTGFVPMSDGFAQVIWKAARQHQFCVLSAPEISWTLPIDQMLEPPFVAGYIAGTNGGSPRLNVWIYHALYDGWAWDLVAADFQALLAARRPMLTRRPFQDVVRYELGVRERAREATSDFWREKLVDAGETKFPCLHGKDESIITPGTTTQSLCLPISRNDLEESAKGEGVAPQVLVQASWAYLLSLYVGSSDITFGTVVSGRTIPLEGIEEIIGPTISTLPIRAKVDPSSAARDLLRAIQNFNRGHLEHSELGLREIKKICGLDGSFDTLMVWQQSLFRNDSGTVKMLDSRDRLEFAVLLEVEPCADKIILKATSKTEFVPEQYLATLLRQLSEFVSAIAKNPGQQLSSILSNIPVEMLSIVEQKSLGSATEDLVTMIERAVGEAPHSVAIEYASDIVNDTASLERITYSEMNAQANRLARYVESQLSGGADELVAIIMEKSILCYVSILAVLKAGAGYLPITPETPHERVRQIVENAEVHVVLTSRDVGVRHVLPETVSVNIVEDIDLSALDGSNLKKAIRPNHVVYAVFTSGSTGVPKGVLVEHRQLVSNLVSLAQFYPVSENGRMLQFTSIGFDVSVFEIFFTWLRGMTLCTANKDVLLRDLENAVNALGITHLSGTPSVIGLLHPENVPGVKFLVVAGEAMTRKVYQQWAGKGLWQGYGPSETTNVVTANHMGPENHIYVIGRPLENVSAFVVVPDRSDLVMVPRGSVGELCYGGTQVARGYLKMPELTANKFIEHPQYGRIYRTGDIGKLLDGDELQYLGRIDDQVKIRGNRIELREIDSVLIQSKAVDEAITMVSGDQEANNQQLVSFVVLKGLKSLQFGVYTNAAGMQRRLDNLNERLTSFVPPYMVPTAIVPVSSIPHTQVGKVDKRALLKAYNETVANGPNLTKAGKLGLSKIERKIAAVAADVAKANIDDIGPDTSIFRLGLDSISSIQLSHRLQKAGYKRLDISIIMRNPTISALSKVLESASEPALDQLQNGKRILANFADSVKAGVLGELGYESDAIVKVLPCTPLQEAMLSLKKGADPKMYFNHTVIELKIDAERLRAAWASVVERNEIMRTCFAGTIHSHHAYAQIVLKHHPLNWTQEVTSNATALSQLVSFHINRVSGAMDTRKPPYEFTLITAPERSLLVMSFHHSLYDGFAMDLLLEDVKRAYSGQTLATRRPFDDFLAYAESLDLEASDKFWHSQLDCFEATSFPDLTGKSTNYKQRALSGMATSTMVCSKPLNIIDSACRDISVSLQAVGQSTWARLLSVYTGDRDVCFGNVVSGRTVPVAGVETMIAPCFNTVPIRIQVREGDTIQSVLKELQKLSADVLPFQLTPLRRIMSQMKTQGQGLFDTLFILQQRQSSREELWEIVEDRGEMDFAVVLELVPNAKSNTLEINLHFRRDTLLESDSHVVLKHLDALLDSALSRPNHLALDFAVFDKSLLAISNPTPQTLTASAPGLIHSAFEHHAARSPDALALEFLTADHSLETLTYSQLNSKANQIAHHLLSFSSESIARDAAIPIVIEKSPLFYICVLAVLKIGCAFTPIDPTLPEQRKSFMLSELKAQIVMADSSTRTGVHPDEGVVVLELDTVDLDGQSTTNPNVPDLTDSCLAYRLYTSGSTGLPKAVSVQHNSAVQTILVSTPHFPFTTSSRFLQFAATTFDMCYYDIFLSWSAGITLCSAHKSHLLGDLAATISTLKVSILDLTPTVAMTLRPSELPDVKLLYCIGEAMPRTLVDSWEGRCVNSYGPTEAAMCCTITPVSSDTKSINIGAPFSTASFYILSPETQALLPIFAAGELCIGGPQVAREYHNNSELTASRFITLHGQRLYRTGDVVRMLADGTFEFIGRADDQVKIRGLRVELDEINTVLREADERIQEAVTIVIRHSADSKEQLVSFLSVGGRTSHGFVQTIQAEQELVTAVREKAANKLPRYMVPGVLLVIDRISLSAAGKVDKKSLTALFQDQDPTSFTTAVEDDLDWSEEEEKVRAALVEASGVPSDQISKDSTIYELGLDSISASQLARRLQQKGLQISVLDVLERPSIALLSPLLAHKPNGQLTNGVHDMLGDFQDQFWDAAIEEAGAVARDVMSVLPCSATQEGMLSQFLNSGGKLYFNHTLLQLPSDVDVQRLRDAWKHVFQASEILRAGFVGIEHQQHSFAMVIYEAEAVDFPWRQIPTEGDQMASAVSLQKQKAAASALARLHLPPWRVAALTTSSSVYLLFSGHHALYDATSLQHIFNDVATFYQKSSIQRRPSITSTLESIVKHSASMSTIDADRDFWLTQLAGSTPSKFPYLTPLRIASTAYATEEFTTSWSLSHIEAECRKLGVSLQAAGQASWAKILAAYLGETAVTLGIVLSGRTGLADSQDVMFPCVVTLPSLVVLEGTSNAELATAVRDSNTRLLKHQHTPLRAIQRWFEHPEEGFFDSLFVYQKTSSSRESLPWKTVAEEASADYTISLELEPAEGDQLLLRTTFRESHIPAEQAALLLRQFDAILMDLLQHPENLFTDYTTLPRELLSVTPAEVENLPCDAVMLHQFVEKHARETPEATAFEFADAIAGDKVSKRTWTYRQLNEEANRIANLLLEHGAKTGEIVAISFEKCPEATFALVGILKAGCAFVALDYTAPIDRKVFITTDSRARIILTQDKFVAELSSALDCNIISIENSDDLKNASTSTPEIPDLTPDCLCYCLYTSGTTGTPKGCEITHANSIQAMCAFSHMFAKRWTPTSKLLQFAAYHFDVCVYELFWSWSVGITCVSCPRDLIFSDLAGTLRALSITHLDLTPSLAALLSPEEVPSLVDGIFISGGEALKQDILDKWGATGALHNGYGPTEVTIGCTMYPRVPANGKPSNIGVQFPNVGSYVFQPGTNKPVLRGAMGELCVSGTLVGKGYLNRPELTAEKFPYLEDFGERIYRTGDVVRILHNGCFDFAGRADDQVKLRGQRLEIGEINEVVKQSSSAITSIATLVLRHPKQQKDQLVSFIVLDTPSDDLCVLTNPENAALISQLTQACKAKLPAYMVPTHFLPISKMPLSVNNKVDNKVLKNLYGETTLEELQGLARRDEDGVWSATEERIRSVLAEATGLAADDINKSSTIFELGLDSVSVVGLARRLKKAGFEVASVSLVMQNFGVKQLLEALIDSTASTVEDRGRLEAARQDIAAFANRHAFEISESLSLDSDSIEKILPCSSLQEGMIVRFLDSDSDLYFNTFVLALRAGTDLSRLRTAWEDVVASTDVLRTAFCETPDGYAQAVLRKSKLQWEEVIAKGPDDFVSSFGRSLQTPPLSLAIVKTLSGPRLVLTIFHALYDGNSLPLILADVEAAYAGLYKPRTSQYPDVVPHMFATDLVAAKSYWTSLLADTVFTPLPSLTSTPSAIDCSAQLHTTFTSTSLAPFLKAASATPQALFLAAFSSTLSSYLKTPNPVFGLVVSGRSLPLDDIETVIGPLFNTIPCVARLGDLTWTGLVQQMQRFAAESVGWQHTPLRMAQKWCRRKELFDALFVYQKEARTEETEKLWEMEEGRVVADYPFALEVEETAEGAIMLTAVAKGEIADESALQQFLLAVDSNVHAILDSPQSSIAVSASSSTAPSSNNNLSNGVQATSSFTWTPTSLTIKTTIATLAEVPEDKFSEKTSIFELGLDSIEAIKLSSRLRHQGILITVSEIMRNHSIAMMIEHLSSSQAQTNGTETSTRYLTTFAEAARKQLGSLEEIEDVYPTTPLQEAMIAESLASENRHYFNHNVLRLEPWVHVFQLRRAWETVVSQNQILRTRFFVVQDEALRKRHVYGGAVLKEGFGALQWNEIREDETTIEEEMERIRTTMDLTQAPPLVLTLFSGAEQQHLLVSISHALYDGWSLSLLMHDIRRAYDNLELDPRPSPRPLLENIFSTDLSAARRFWSHTLSSAISCSFPVSFSADPLTTHRTALSSSLSSSTITAFCKTHSTTPQSLFHLSWGLVLSHHLALTDVIFNAVLAGRDGEEEQATMWPVMNTVPVRMVLHGAYKDMLKDVRENAAKVGKWGVVGLREVMKCAGGRRLADSLVVVNQLPDSGADTAEKNELWKEVGGEADVEYNVCIEVSRTGDSLEWGVAAKSNIMDAKAAQKLLEMLDGVMQHIVSNPEHATVTYTEAGMQIGNTPAVTRDAQQVLNGVLVDLDEVAAEVKKVDPAITGARAVIINHDNTDKLAVFMSPALDPESTATIAAAAKKTLPHWSMPSFIIPLPSLADRDRTALSTYFTNIPESDLSQYALATSTTWTPTERLLRHTLSRVAGIPEDEITRTQTIFHLGLDSISAIHLSSELRQQGLLLSVAAIVREATIERMAGAAKRLDAEEESEIDTDAVLSNAVQGVEITEELEDVQELLPVLPGQLYMLSCWHTSGYSLFLPTFIFRSSTPLAVQRVKQAWNVLCAEEPVLRSIFLPTNDEMKPFVQAVLKNPEVQFTSHEVSHAVGAKLLQLVKAQEQKAVKKCFGERRPMARLAVVTAPEESVLFLTLHHALYDGVSLPLLLDKLRQLVDGVEVVSDDVGWREYVAQTISSSLSQQKSFWTSFLSGATSTLTPSHSTVTTSRTSLFLPSLLPSPSVSTLEALCRHHGISLHALLLASFSKAYLHIINSALSPLKQKKDLIFGVYFSNRAHPFTSMTVPTLNILPLRVRDVEKSDLVVIAKSVQEDLAVVAESRGVGLMEIREWTGVEVDAFFNYLRMPGKGGSDGQGRDSWAEVELASPSGEDEVEGDVEGVEELKGSVLDTIRTNLDIEAGVSKDGNLSMGVFAKPEVMGTEEARRMVGWIAEMLVGWAVEVSRSSVFFNMGC